MAYYMIHTCFEREWYVRSYLVPSMIAQGIEPERIQVYTDGEHNGCLESCMDSFSKCEHGGGIWHLQDDVIISSNFKQITEEYDYGIVCGIATQYDRNRASVTGKTTVNNMWYSFPCIRIPNEISRGCADWYRREMEHNPVYDFAQTGKHDDEVFRMYVEFYHKDVVVTNLKPNIVDHIDYLIGGSTINKARKNADATALYFDEPKLVKELEVSLNART